MGVKTKLTSDVQTVHLPIQSLDRPTKTPKLSAWVTTPTRAVLSKNQTLRRVGIRHGAE